MDGYVPGIILLQAIQDDVPQLLGTVPLRTSTAAARTYYFVFFDRDAFCGLCSDHIAINTFQENELIMREYRHHRSRQAGLPGVTDALIVVLCFDPFLPSQKSQNESRSLIGQLNHLVEKVILQI